MAPVVPPSAPTTAPAPEAPPVAPTPIATAFEPTPTEPRPPEPSPVALPPSHAAPIAAPDEQPVAAMAAVSEPTSFESSGEATLHAPATSPPVPSEAAFVPAPVVVPPHVPASMPSPAFTPMAGGAALASRVAVARARFVSAIPPQWLELARRQPVLWMVVAPVALASLLILLAVALAPEIESARAEPVAIAAAAAAPAAAASPASPAAAPEAPDDATIARLNAKPPSALSVEEVLLVKAHRADLKRKDAQALASKLQQQPELAKDAPAQQQLLRLAIDPDTAEVALTALARTPSPIAKDLLYEVWTSRTAPAATAELAGSLLSSRDVRSGASSALSAALALRSAGDCEAVQAALPHALSDGDRRSLATLGKLSSRRGCGADKSEDCYPCLRSRMKEVTAAVNAVKRRRAPSYAAP